MPASQISAQLGISPSSLPFHLKEMVHASLLASRQDGRFVIYMANFKTINEVAEFLTENCCNGRSCAPAGTPTCATTEGVPS